MCNLRKGIISNSTVCTLEKPNEQATGKLKVRGDRVSHQVDCY